MSAALSAGADAGTCQCSCADAEPGRFAGATSFNRDITRWSTPALTNSGYMYATRSPLVDDTLRRLTSPLRFDGATAWNATYTRSPASPNDDGPPSAWRPRGTAPPHHTTTPPQTTTHPMPTTTAPTTTTAKPEPSTTTTISRTTVTSPRTTSAPEPTTAPPNPGQPLYTCKGATCVATASGVNATECSKLCPGQPQTFVCVQGRCVFSAPGQPGVPFAECESACSVPGPTTARPATTAGPTTAPRYTTTPPRTTTQPGPTTTHGRITTPRSTTAPSPTAAPHKKVPKSKWVPIFVGIIVGGLVLLAIAFVALRRWRQRKTASAYTAIAQDDPAF